MSVSLASLNAEQRKAAETIEGPVLVLAGAGTGKTRVLTTRLALLMSKGHKPASLLAVTFTNKAAREMRARAAKLAGPSAKEVWLSTFHSLCSRILRKEIEALGWRKDFAIYDDSDQESVVRSVLKELRVPGVQATPDAVKWRIGQAKNRGWGAEEMAKESGEEIDIVAARAFEKYQAGLKSRNAVDFDDLLFLTVRLFREHPAVLEKYRKQFRYLMVDEYQDTNAVQYEIVKSLAGKRRNLFVVGDDDQSIYGWRGADHAHILQFEADFPGAAVVRLEQNYRSTGAILESASELIRHNAARHAKKLYSKLGAGTPVRTVLLYDERAEALWVAEQIKTSVRRRSAFAVLFRTNAETRPFEEQLRLARVPYSVVGGQRFYDRREVRDVLAYLRLASNPHDDAALARIANVPPRGIGETSMEKLDSFAASKGLPLLDAFRRAGEAGLAPGSAESARRLAAKVDGWRSQVTNDAARGARVMVEELDLFGELRRETENTESAEARVGSIESVLDDLAAHARGGGDLRGYLEKVALLDKEEPDDDQKEAVTLLTAHAAKGLEFPVVFVVGMTDGIFPHRRSASDEKGLEEERRLLYVAMTRAKEELILTRPEHRTSRGKTAASLPSRFLVELPGGIEREAPGKRELTSDETAALDAKIQSILAGKGPEGAR
ncbi:MAG: DNA helicase II / ATP-dependent DNA helicase [Planctomycetota bacterium]|nr:MAG: DNA helicase II / ATP-dependent DNA helicase [Planctomycetota bacterium]